MKIVSQLYIHGSKCLRNSHAENTPEVNLSIYQAGYRHSYGCAHSCQGEK